MAFIVLFLFGGTFIMLMQGKIDLLVDLGIPATWTPMDPIAAFLITSGIYLGIMILFSLNRDHSGDPAPHWMDEVAPNGRTVGQIVVDIDDKHNRWKN